MADSYVGISVRATDGAKPDLEALKARLEELNKQVATARADVDDAQGDAVLTALEAKLAAVGKQVANPKIDMQGASKALAQATSVDAALRKMDDDRAAAEAKAVAGAKAAADAEAASAGEAADAQVAAARRAGLGVDELQAKLDDLGGRVATAQVNVKGGDSKLELMALQEELDKLGATVARPDIDARGVIEAKKSFDDLAARAEEDGVKSGASFSKSFLGSLRSEVGSGGILGQGEAEKSGSEEGGIFGNSFVTTFLGGKKSTITAGISSAMAALPALGAVAGVGMVGALGVAVANQIPAVHAQFAKLGSTVMSTLTSAVQPMVPFISSAVTQIGGFVKSIGPELSGLFKDVGPMIQPLVSGLEGLVKGLLPGLSGILKAAMPAVTAFGSVLSSLGKNLGGLLSSMAPAVAASAGVMKALFDAVGGLLPVIGKLAAVMAGALAPVLTSIGSAVKALAPAFTAIGKVVAEFAEAFLGNLQGGLTAVIGLVKSVVPAFGMLAGALGKVFNLMNNRGVMNDLEDAIEELVGPLGKLITALVVGLLPVLPALVGLLSAVANAFQAGLVSAVTALVNAFIPLIPVISKVAIIVADVLASGVTALTPLLVKLAPAVLAIVGAMKAWSIIQAIMNIELLSNPLVLFGLAIVVIVGLIVELVKHSHVLAAAFDVVRHAAAELGHDIASVFDKIRHDIATAVDGVVSFVKDHWKLLATILATVLLGPVAGLVVFLATHWKQVKQDVSDLVSDVTGFFSRLWKDVTGDVSRGVGTTVGWFKGLPGRILGALGNLGTLLYDSGAKIVRGLINGIKSMLGEVGNAAESVVGEIKNFLPFSPAKKGPLSGAGAPNNSGRSVARMFAQGITSGLPDVTAAMTRLTGTAARSRPGSAGVAGAGGGVVKVQLEWSGNATDALIRGLRQQIRIRGGNVQNVLGT